MTLRGEVPKLRQLNCLFSESHGKVVGHCLDLDVVATGKTLDEVNKKLVALMKGYIESLLLAGNWSNLNTPAPKSYWDQFNTGESINLEPSTIEIRVPEVVPMANTSSTLGMTSRQLQHVA